MEPANLRPCQRASGSVSRSRASAHLYARRGVFVSPILSKRLPEWQSSLAAAATCSRQLPGQGVTRAGDIREVAVRRMKYSKSPAGPNMNVRKQHGTTSRCRMPRSAASSTIQQPMNRSKAR